MKTLYNELHTVTNGKGKWERADAAKLVSAYEARDQTIRQRDFAKKPMFLGQHCGIGLPGKTASMLTLSWLSFLKTQLALLFCIG